MIFFDLDETLFDFKGAEYLGIKAFYLECGHNIDLHEDEFYNIWCKIGKKHFDRYLKGELSFRQLQTERVKDVLMNTVGIPQIIDNEAFDYYLIYLTNYEKNWKAFEDVKPCLEKLSKYRLGIISNGDLVQQKSKLEKLGILDCFDIIVTSGDIGIAKPDTRIFQSACQSAGKKPDECFYIGDNLQTDIMPCLEINMKGIWLNRKGNSDLNEKYKDITVIESLKGLPALLQG